MYSIIYENYDYFRKNFVLGSVLVFRNTNINFKKINSSPEQLSVPWRKQTFRMLILYKNNYGLNTGFHGGKLLFQKQGFHGPSIFPIVLFLSLGSFCLQAYPSNTRGSWSILHPVYACSWTSKMFKVSSLLVFLGGWWNNIVYEQEYKVPWGNLQGQGVSFP